MKLRQTVNNESDKAGLYLNLKNIKILSIEKIYVLRRGVCHYQSACRALAKCLA